MKKNALTIINDLTTEALPRPYLGLSAIGEECHRKLQFDHYWAYKTQIPARIQRLFNVGHSAEEIMIADLKKIGIETTNEQKEIIATAEHWKGHIDGIGHLEDEQFLLEFKTHNDKSFKDLKKNEVKKSKPMHYAQMTAYMGYLGLEKALYMAYNKNDSEYYLEWVDFDEEHFDELKRKELEVLAAETLLPRIGTGMPTWFKCKFCSAKDVCFLKTPIELHCRTCKYVDVLPNGKWACDKHNIELSVEEQKDGCSIYNLSEMFL